MKKTFEKTNDVVVPPDTTRAFPVWVVVRHTRAGDDYRKFLVVQRPERLEELRRIALHYAEDIANEAARDYGYGSASVFKGTLLLNKAPETPE